MTETTNDTETFTVTLTGGEPEKPIPWKQILVALGIAATLLRSG